VRTFKFLSKPFNPRDYDFEGFTFIGVSTIHRSIIDTRPYRIMVYMDNRTNSPILANRIREDEEPYHQADVIEVLGNRIHQLPREVQVTLTYTRNETL
jgi:hypothetical protein